MKSRAHMLLEKEYLKLQKEPLWGIIAKPLNDGNFFLWEANICGLKDTMWEGGIFKVYLKFSDMYDFVAPQVMFRTIPFHPNVDMSSGKPCIDFLDNTWDQKYNIVYILLTLQTLLVNPAIENAVNQHAASIYLNNPKMYRKMVMDCILESQRLNAKLPPRLNHKESKLSAQHAKVEDRKNQKLSSIHVNKITFGDYLSLWKGMATSSHPTGANNLKEILKYDSKLERAHFELSKEELEEEIRLQFKEHNRIMYGTVVAKEEEPIDNCFPGKRRPNKVQLIRHIPLSPSPPSLLQTASPVDDYLDFDKETDDLVNWTRNLSPEHINF